MPRSDPRKIAVESAISARSSRAILPSTRRPARLATPISVPVASNSSTRNITRTTLRSPPESAAGMSRANSVGAIDGGRETTPEKLFPAKTKLSAVP